MTLRTFITLLAALTVVCCGCSRSRSWNEYVPKEQQARQALETALNAWKNDQPMDKIPGVKPAVQAHDFQWQDGQKLANFEILKNEAAGSGPQWFQVKLTLKDSDQEETVRYAVLGIDPLMVYREEDFKKLEGKGDS